MLKFLQKLLVIRKLRKGWTLVRYPFGHYAIESGQGDEQFIPLWLGVELWHGGRVAPNLIRDENPMRRMTFTLIK